MSQSVYSTGCDHGTRYVASISRDVLADNVYDLDALRPAHKFSDALNDSQCEDFWRGFEFTVRQERARYLS